MKKLDELLEQFENGEERAHKDPLFRKTIMELMSGVPPLIIIDKLLGIVSEQQETIGKLIVEGPSTRYVIKKEHAEAFLKDLTNKTE